MNAVFQPKMAFVKYNPQVGAVAVTAWSIHLPGFDLKDVVPGCSSGPHCPPEQAHELLGRKRLLGKDDATRLALCAVHRALNLAPGSPPSNGVPDANTAVVASSNLGNAATVHNIAKALRHGGIRDVSPLDAPNASSNVLASAVAIWFKFGGPNLMVCSGATSGLDAVALASTLLRTCRADRVIVVGAEPGDAVARKLYRLRTFAAPAEAEQLCACAAALEMKRAAEAVPGTPLLGPVRSAPDLSRLPTHRHPSILVGPAGMDIGALRTIDLGQHIKGTYGALGVLQVAVAAALFASAPIQTRPSIAVICGDQFDGWRSTVVTEQSRILSM